MTSIRTELVQPRSEHASHGPSSSIPKSNAWDAIQYLYSLITATGAVSYVTATAEGALTNEHVLTDTSTVAWDASTGVAKANLQSDQAALIAASFN